MTGLLARLLLSTAVIDRLYRRFEAARLELVLAFASDRFLERYNDLVYAQARAYHPGASDFRDELFPWEVAVVDRFFPAPPARVLVGAAGGGREAFALARRGFAVVAFEPSDNVNRMAEARPAGADVEVYRARYADLPAVRSLDGGATRLDERPSFDAGVIGWASFSHLVNDEERVAALRQMTGLVAGPVLVSYFGGGDEPAAGPATGLRRLRLARTGARRAGYSFTIHVGGYRQLAEADLRRLCAKGGVDVLFVDSKAEWPHAVVRRSARWTPAGEPASATRPLSST